VSTDSTIQGAEVADAPVEIRGEVVTDTTPVFTFKAEPNAPVSLILVDGRPIACFSDPREMAEYLPGPALFQSLGDLLEALEASMNGNPETRQALRSAIGRALVTFRTAQSLRGAEPPKLITLS
jgi:hypothetical protein